VSHDELGSQARATDRLAFFSDAVVAIAITLLAIDLPVPSGRNLSQFWESAAHDDGHYAAFLISFVAIAVAWSHHHEVFRYVERVDARLRTLNMAWLMMIILNPFATKLLTAKNHQDLGLHALHFGFYALLLVLSAVAMLAMERHMISHRLLAPGAAARPLITADWQSYGMIIGFGLSIPFFFVTTYAWVLWIVVPLLAGYLQGRRGPAAW
jgi:uncharacterized membrane protein